MPHTHTHTHPVLSLPSTGNAPVHPLYIQITRHVPPLPLSLSLTITWHVLRVPDENAIASLPVSLGGQAEDPLTYAPAAHHMEGVEGYGHDQGGGGGAASFNEILTYATAAHHMEGRGTDGQGREMQGEEGGASSLIDPLH